MAPTSSWTRGHSSRTDGTSRTLIRSTHSSDMPWVYRATFWKTSGWLLRLLVRRLTSLFFTSIFCFSCIHSFFFFFFVRTTAQNNSTSSSSSKKQLTIMSDGTIRPVSPVSTPNPSLRCYTNKVPDYIYSDFKINHFFLFFLYSGTWLRWSPWPPPGSASVVTRASEVILMALLVWAPLHYHHLILLLLHIPSIAVSSLSSLCVCLDYHIYRYTIRKKMFIFCFLHF